MNSIRRPRRRPRVTSVNFRTLWWLVAFEAAYQIEAEWWRLCARGVLSRTEFMFDRLHSWRRRASRLLDVSYGVRILE